MHKHFDIADWSDYVRGVVSPAGKTAMAAHLSEGCETCAETVAMLTRLADDAMSETTVPEPLVRSVKAIHPGRAARPAFGQSLPRLIAQLIFSSLNEPLPAGARSAAEAAVQAVYHAGDFAIDLQIEPEQEFTDMALVGQVVRRSEPPQPVAGIPVGLTARGKTLAVAQSNRFGEFCLVARLHHGMRLCVDFEQIGKRVEIPLDKLTASFRL